MKFMKYLIDIPNEEGFKFIGITYDDDKINCIVMKNPAGCHSVYDDHGTPVFSKLRGWEPKP